MRILFRGLFNDAVSIDITYSRMVGWQMIHELQRIRKIAAVFWSRHYLGICLERLRITTNDLLQGSRCPGRDSNLVHPESNAHMNTHWICRVEEGSVKCKADSVSGGKRYHPALCLTRVLSSAATMVRHRVSACCDLLVPFHATSGASPCNSGSRSEYWPKGGSQRKQSCHYEQEWNNAHQLSWYST
jgi:hypothetical protein